MRSGDAIKLGKARFLMVGIDQLVDPPRVLIKIVDAGGSRRGNFDDAQRFLDDMRASGLDIAEAADGK